MAVREAAEREVVVREAARGGHGEQEACRALVQATGRITVGHWLAHATVGDEQRPQSCG